MSSTNDGSGANWQDLIVAERMAVDREFQARVDESSFSNQAWELVMTAVEFEIENPETPDNAHITVNSEHLESVLPAMKEAEQALGQPQGKSSFSSKLGSGIRDLLGGGGDDAKRRAEAEELAGEYAKILHSRLQRQGKWEMVCERAAP